MKQAFLIPAALLTVVACSDQPVEPAPLGPSPEPSASTASQAFGGSDLDDLWASIARDSLSGFAGYWRTETGEYVIGIAGPASVSEATTWLQNRLASQGRSFSQIRSRTVPHGFDLLKQWKDALVGLLDDSTVYWLDIDETQNQLVFGAADPATSQPLLDSVAEIFGVPSGAVSMVKSEEILPRVSLQNWVRPVVGGLRIEHWDDVEDRKESCTLGFNAYRGRTRGFVTASHCSTYEKELDGEIQYQSLYGVSNHRIGRETIDPTSNRKSDAAFYRYDAGVTENWGHIARTLYPVVNDTGPITIDTTHPGLRITAKGPNSIQIVGELVNKVGQRTGWTQGQITKTCVTLSDYPCQWEATVYSQTGDSGAPIFQQNGPYEPEASEVSLWGILHGGPPGDWTTSWYSPISGVEEDLGSLWVTCPPSPDPCDPPLFLDLDGPPFISESGDYEWTASGTGGNGVYSYAWERRLYHVTSTCTFIGPWTDEGTGSTYTETVNVPGYNFQLQVTVSSGSQVTSKRQIIGLSSHLHCPY